MNEMSNKSFEIRSETWPEPSRLESGSAVRRAGAWAPSLLFRHRLWALAAAAIISGCSTAVQSPPLYPTYRPTVTARPAPAASAAQSHIVRASWYGPGFNGRRTSSGQTFNEHTLTAASKTLPLGSRVRVTNLGTGSSVVVRVNDRGPFVRGRSLDLSEAAASRIGIAHEGVAKVKITRLNVTRGRFERLPATVPAYEATGATSSEPSSPTSFGPFDLGFFGLGK
jgi:rare lipoprotein A